VGGSTLAGDQPAAAAVTAAAATAPAPAPALAPPLPPPPPLVVCRVKQPEAESFCEDDDMEPELNSAALVG
jgi:hypothetical protein